MVVIYSGKCSFQKVTSNSHKERLSSFKTDQNQGYDPARTKEERQFLQKLDLSLLTILSLGYFIKNLDQTNISNAYVSGMKEALHMNSDELNLIDVAWTTGYVIGQVLSQFILTKIRTSI